MMFNLIVTAAVLAVFLCGMYLGYEIGVKETERRWSDAIARADHDREQEAEVST